MQDWAVSFYRSGDMFIKSIILNIFSFSYLVSLGHWIPSRNLWIQLDGCQSIGPALGDKWTELCDQFQQWTWMCSWLSRPTHLYFLQLHRIRKQVRALPVSADQLWSLAWISSEQGIILKYISSLELNKINKATLTLIETESRLQTDIHIK